ncbi:hypothetical protein H2200_008390 [Cladophialophora chaetospira]|uniref:Uncharacterized protein n=1 Tax=Cladophialophora chaetospira TaxID=386627 RepID=A0AA39CGD6_9EURO|nr:hypothetical protein H2200_008390 [Cladophialophora chaetospira]
MLEVRQGKVRFGLRRRNRRTHVNGCSAGKYGEEPRLFDAQASIGLVTFDFLKIQVLRLQRQSHSGDSHVATPNIVSSDTLAGYRNQATAEPAKKEQIIAFTEAQSGTGTPGVCKLTGSLTTGSSHFKFSRVPLSPLFPALRPVQALLPKWNTEQARKSPAKKDYASCLMALMAIGTYRGVDPAFPKPPSTSNVRP